MVDEGVFKELFFIPLVESSVAKAMTALWITDNKNSNHRKPTV